MQAIRPTREQDLKRTLLATAILVLLAARRIRRRARSRVPDQARPDGGRHRVGTGPARGLGARGRGPVQQLAVLDNEAVDVFETPDIDHDGYADLAIGQSGGGTQARMRLFLYRPNEGTTRRSAIPRPRPAPATASSIPYSTPASPPSPRVADTAPTARHRKATPCAQTARPFPCPGSRRSGSRRQARRSRPGTSSTAMARWPESCWTAKARRSTAATTWRPRPRRSLTRPTSRTAHRRSCAASGMTWWRCGRRAGCKCACPQKDAAGLKWLRYVDLVIDRHGLAPSAQGDAPASDQQAR